MTVKQDDSVGAVCASDSGVTFLCPPGLSGDRSSLVMGRAWLWAGVAYVRKFETHDGDYSEARGAVIDGRVPQKERCDERDVSPARLALGGLP